MRTKTSHRTENNLPTNPDLNSRRTWIDLVLVLGGIACVTKGVAFVGVPLVSLGAVTPLLRFRRRERSEALAAFVPPELVEAHRGLVGAAALPGVVDGPEVIAAADDALLETAAFLVGRPPRGVAQRRFVATRVTVMRETERVLRERHKAFADAVVELDALARIPTSDAPASPADPEPASWCESSRLL
jgi:hypothetical protein